jgi:fatty acid desaturase
MSDPIHHAARVEKHVEASPLLSLVMLCCAVLGAVGLVIFQFWPDPKLWGIGLALMLAGIVPMAGIRIFWWLRDRKNNDSARKDV